MVHLQKLHDRYAKDGLFVFAISMMPDAEAARKLNQELGITFPVFDGNESDLGRQYAFG